MEWSRHSEDSFAAFLVRLFGAGLAVAGEMPSRFFFPVLKVIANTILTVPPARKCPSEWERRDCVFPR